MSEDKPPRNDDVDRPAVPTDPRPPLPPSPEPTGPQRPDPTRYNDWEKGGRCIDF